MEQNDFLNLLRKYRQGEATPEEKKLIDEWYAALERDVYHPSISGESELDHLYQSTIYTHVKKSKKEKQKMLVLWYSADIAAAILLTMISYFCIIDYRGTDNTLLTEKKETPSYLKQVTNTTQATLVFVLPDSSKVSLEPESTLKFSTAFNTTEREVYLEGEAFFNVTHNRNLPFVVHANEVTTKVLGTSFVIKALEHEQKITVAVKTGKVSVFAHHENEQESSPAKEIVLTPNQQIVYDKKDKGISKTLVPSPRVVLPQEEVRHMRFEEAPVSEIFEALEKAYGVDIEFDKTTFSSCELTTVISNDDIYSRLNIICHTIGSSYTLREDRIIISGSGCKAKRK